jgi:hypothetical protein
MGARRPGTHMGARRPDVFSNPAEVRVSAAFATALALEQL